MHIGMVAVFHLLLPRKQVALELLQGVRLSELFSPGPQHKPLNLLENGEGHRGKGRMAILQVLVSPAPLGQGWPRGLLGVVDEKSALMESQRVQRA